MVPTPRDSPTPEGPRPAAVRALPIDGLDGALAALLCLALFALYSATLQERKYGDGAALTQMFVESLDSATVWPHVLYMPVGRALYRLFDWSSPVEALRTLSSLGGALGAGCIYVVCRAFDAGRAAAALGALLLALCPGYWFFSTTVEVVGLHVGCVGLCAAVTVCAPWRRPVLAALLTAACLPLLFLSHQSGLFLGPGFVLLAQYARARSGAGAFRLRTLLFVIGPLFLSSFVFAVWLSAYLRHTTFAHIVGFNSEFVASYSSGFSVRTFYRLWLEPLGALLPLALAALALRRVRGWALAAVVGMVLPSLVFFSMWGVHERGAYALSSAGLLAASCAALFGAGPRAWRLTVPVLVAVQGAFGFASVSAFDAPHWGEENRSRASAVERVLGSSGTLFAINYRFQRMAGELPGVTEVNLYPDLYRAWGQSQEPQAFAEEIAGRIESAVAEGQPVVLDTSCRRVFEETAARQLLPYLDALEERLAETCRVTRRDDPVWPLLRIERSAAGD